MGRKAPNPPPLKPSTSQVEMIINGRNPPSRASVKPPPPPSPPPPPKKK